MMEWYGGYGHDFLSFYAENLRYFKREFFEKNVFLWDTMGKGRDKARNISRKCFKESVKTCLHLSSKL